MDAFPRVACPVRGKRHAPLYDDASAHRTLASVPEGWRHGAAATGRPMTRRSFFDRRAGKDTDDCRARIVRIATAEINASGIVGAYFESRQTCPEYSRHSAFPIFKMADYDRNAALRHASPLMVYANILRLTIPLVGHGIIVSRSNRI
ncbi:hypothetical protein LGN30_23260 [Burkholderia seminalis]|uniref:hypothetical protein n=1 Tax=Burkholderia seminalis TaxID=488731 RepID=UPI001CF5EEBA|nr:hypothetical protein [Burkholderia seminalis]MCA8426104.1 hypothetical protein [Burkholderia seminalis]